jgi:SAM-dependent methyltransferase
MHASAYEHSRKFVERYLLPRASQGLEVLEVGSLDVNGSVRDFAPEGANWVGIDLEAGPGVDIVVDIPLSIPFPDNHFDFAIASSVFEHDSFFWSTLQEMARVVKSDGYIFITAPSNGVVHRYPFDSYRFYPDAGNSFVSWLVSQGHNAVLAESFIALQDGGIWNDFVAVIGFDRSPEPEKSIYSDSSATNVWSQGKFLDETFVAEPEDRMRAQQLSEYVKGLEDNLRKETEQLQAILNSRSWKLTKPLRFFRERLTLRN